MNAQSNHIPQREDVRNRIIEVAIAAFHSEGIKNVTMDDIAHRLTMSKRTLYQIFSDKEELLLACIRQHNEKDHARIVEIRNYSENVLDFLIRIFVFKLREIDGIKPSFFSELIKYPKVVKFFEQEKKTQEDEAVTFLRQGIEQGYFIETVNFHIVYRHLSTLMGIIVYNELGEQYPQSEIFLNTVLPIFRGVATQKGLEIIDRFLSQICDTTSLQEILPEN